MLEKINNHLNPKRLKYPWIISGIIWVVWLVTLLAGKGNLDLSGNLKGTDFTSFYTAGKIVLLGRSSELYDLNLVNEIQQDLYGFQASGFNPYLNPPHFAALVSPLAALPYILALFIWIALGLLFFWFSIKWLGTEKPEKTALWAITWFPVFAVVSFGQNSFFTLAVFCLTFFLWSRNRNWIAGLVFSLLLLKPQFLTGIGFLWIMDWRRSWKSLLGLGMGILLQIALNFLLLPEASASYLEYTKTALPNLLHLEGFPIWNAFSVQSFWLSLMPSQPVIAAALYWICLALGLFFFVRFWKNFRSHKPAAFLAAVLLTVWGVPYIMIYDWTLLLIPAILLWQSFPGHRETLKASFAVMWVAGLLSSVLAYLQAQTLPMVIQIAIPIFLWVNIEIYRTLMMERSQSQLQND